MEESPKILIAADGFLTEDVLRTALNREVPDASVSVISNDWPILPSEDYSGIQEAAGDEDQLIAALDGQDVCFSQIWPLSERVLDACPSLRLVTICRGGPVNVNIPAATRRGIAVTYAPGRNAESTAEHTIGMIMAAARQIAQRDEELKSGIWKRDGYRYDQVSPEIRDSTVGVIGYGAVGSRVAHVMAAMGAHVLTYDPWADPTKIESGTEVVDNLDELLRRSKIVTVHARVTAENHHMIAARQIGLMPAGSILINCARGPLMDYDAVADALDSGHLYAAGFDCLPEEPLPAGHRLLTTPRVTMTPHLGGASQQAAQKGARIGAGDIARFLAGEKPRFIANPEVLAMKDR